MPLSVRRLVARPELELRVVAGHGGLDRAISWVHSSEVADPTPWLHGGELLITTGLGRTGADLADLVRRLAAADAAAFGFATGVTFDEVPAEVIAAGDAAGLAVLEVPYEVPFLAISQAVAARIAEEQQATLRDALRAHRAMTRAALDEGAVAGVPPVLARTLGGWAAIADRDGGLTSVAPAEAREEVAVRLPVVRGSFTGGARTVALARPAGQLVAHVLEAGGLTHGHLVVGRERPYDASEQTVIAAAASLVTYEMEQARAAVARARRVDEELLAALLGDEVSAQVAARHVASWGLDPGALTVIVVASRRPVTGLRAEVGTALEAAGVAAVACGGGTAAGDDAGAADGPSRGEPGGTVYVLGSDAEAITTALSEVLAGNNASAGIGAVAAAGRLAESRRQAEQVARIAVQERLTVARVDDFDALSLMLTPAGEAGAGLLVRRLVEPIARAERERGVPLLPSVRAFLDHNGSWAEAAAALGVHRHTLRARMDTVEEVLGRGLDSAYLRLELALALQAYALRGGEAVEDVHDLG